MPALLRYAGATEHDPAIDRWLDRQPTDLGAIARAWFQAMRQCGGDVLEVLHDGFPTACVGDVPFAYVGVFKAHVNVGFFQGATLPDPDGLLEGTGKNMRHVKLRPGPGVSQRDRSLNALLRSAYRDIIEKLEAAG